MLDTIPTIDIEVGEYTIVAYKWMDEDTAMELSDILFGNSIASKQKQYAAMRMLYFTKCVKEVRKGSEVLDKNIIPYLEPEVRGEIADKLQELHTEAADTGADKEIKKNTESGSTDTST